MDLLSPSPVTTVRRNPPRRAKQTSTIHVPSPPKRSNAVVGITAFPLDEILEPEPSRIHPLPKQKPHNFDVGISNNLKVFLRIRPLECRTTQASIVARGQGRACGKGRIANEGKRKNISCLFVNSSSSVTLNPPPTAMESKRAKSEVYNGFSHVFPPESVQEDVYDKVMHPLVMNFMMGHSSLLVAMGPTGSGKTYTMFGTPQQLGIVSLALRQIFSQTTENENIQVSRTYYLSMFEIHSERGKSENFFDLFPDSIPYQQASNSCLKEAKISSVADAEKIVAHGIFKRSTAATNANIQSSRSQCIINVRCVLKSDADDNSLDSAVLTIADLAGAERERKTGNQGARLVESNFINNTSMIFGQCLRSLLEHQKNPKKPIEKHFKNSLLTRYLQDYMEGKKQMTLILTVKAAQDDYMDTSFILRQASPYMKIKFNHLQENILAPFKKRNAEFVRTERSKKRKVITYEVLMNDGDQVVTDAAATNKICEKATSLSVGGKIGNQSYTEFHLELQKIKRSEEVMKNFAKALLSTLKQYKHKLTESENEVQSLKERLEQQITQVLELETELNELRNPPSCLNKCRVEDCAKAPLVNLGVSVLPILSDPGAMLNSDALPDENSVPLREISSEAHSGLLLEDNTKSSSCQIIDEDPECFQNNSHSYVQVEETADVSVNLSDVASLTGPHGNVLANEHELTGKASNLSKCFSQSTVHLEGESHVFGTEEMSIMQDKKEQSNVMTALTENVQQNTVSHLTKTLKIEDPALILLNSKRPKRKLLPASAILLNDLNGLLLDANPMVKRKRAADVKERTDGSMSLIRILKGNLPR